MILISNLCEAIRLSKGFRQAKHGYFLRAESFYNVATKEEDYADAGHPSSRFHAQSHGESFLALAQQQMQPNGIYILDEPEAALSPHRQLTLMLEIHRYAKAGAQFIIVTHSPIYWPFQKPRYGRLTKVQYILVRMKIPLVIRWRKCLWIIESNCWIGCLKSKKEWEKSKILLPLL